MTGKNLPQSARTRNTQPATYTNLDRYFLGFDSLFRDFDRMFDSTQHTNYPPYNIRKVESEDGVEHYQVEIATAGFTKDELEIEVLDQHLIVRGRKEPEKQPNDDVIYQGLAFRDFERRFRITKDVEVDASYENGLLKIDVKSSVNNKGLFVEIK